LTGSFLGAWLLFPLVLLAASVGGGLLVRRLAGGELSTLLVAPVGFALLVVICAFATSYGWLAPLAGPLVVAAAVAGFAVQLRASRPRRPRVRFSAAWLWPSLAAIAVFAAVGGPVFLTGSVGWTGYTRIVDIAFQMDFAQHLADAGRVNPASGNSSYNIVTAKLLGIGYPGGAQAALGVIANLARVNVAWCYQGFLAFAGAMGALAIFSVLGHVTRNGLVRCIGAGVAMQPNILYAYALEAGIKEFVTAALLMVIIATMADQLGGPRARRGMIAPAVAISGAFGTFSLGIAPWLGVLLLGLLAASLIVVRSRRRVLEAWALCAAVAILISVPGIVTAGKLATVAGGAVGGVVNLGLGNLAAPVSKWAASGVWFTGDYRYPLANATPSHVFAVAILALAALGFGWALARRSWVFVVVGVTAAVALYYFIEHSTAWIQFKAFTITAMFTVLLAVVGAAALQASRRRWLSVIGWLSVLLIAGVVLYGNAVTYHDTSLAPGARYRDLAAIANRYAGQGPALDPYFDEYAEFFLRGVSGSTSVDPANFAFAVRPGVPVPPGGVSFEWDLNQLVPSFLERFPLVIQPRSPIASRPPSNYDLVERTRFFEVWRRDRPASTVLDHFPLSKLPHERTLQICRLIVRAARDAGRGAQIAYATGSTVTVANPLEGGHPDYWKPLGASALVAPGAGTVQLSVRLPQDGRYAIWLQGSLGRPVGLYVDGRRVTTAGYEERYPGQYLLLTSTTLRAGTHSVRVVRGNGSLHPGSGDPATDVAGRTLGAIVFAREGAGAGAGAEPVYVAPAARTAQICAAPVGYQWLEVLAPGGAPSDAPAATT
jgi:hypothetical protein